MDDGFELSEEDFLKAALDIEAATQQQHSICKNVTPIDCSLHAAEGAINSRPLVTSSSIFNDSDDSDIDLSLSIGLSENLCGYSPEQTGNHAFKAASVPASKLTVSSKQHLINANGFADIKPTVSRLRISHSFSNTQLKSQSDDVLRLSSNLPLNSEFRDVVSKRLENEVVCQASKSLSQLDQSKAISSPIQRAVVSRSSFPLVSSDENPMRKRKFPGPAGVLPKLKASSKVDTIFSEKPSSVTDVSTNEAEVLDVPCTQSQEVHFQSSAWKAMKDDLGSRAELILNDFCINAIIQKANAKTLPHGKVPVLCAIIEGVKVHSADASVTLRDPSGFIYGTMHRELLRDYLELIQTGTVIILRQVGVLCPSGRRNFYLNITPNNVVGFYNLEESGRPVRMRVRELTEEDFLMLTEEPVQLNSIASPQPERRLETVHSAGALFSTVSSNSPFNQCNRAGSLSNPRLAMTPSGPTATFSDSFESAKLNARSCSTLANTARRSFAVSSIVRQPNTPIQRPALQSPLRPISSPVPNLMSHRTPSVQFQPRPASVQPVPTFSPPVQPHQLLRSLPQSNSGAGLGLFPDTVAPTFIQNSPMSKENLSDNKSSSESSQSTFRFKKLSTAKPLPSSASAGRTNDPVKETATTMAMNNTSSAWNSNDYSDYVDDSLLFDLNNEFLTDF